MAGQNPFTGMSVQESDERASEVALRQACCEEVHEQCRADKRAGRVMKHKQPGAGWAYAVLWSLLFWAIVATGIVVVVTIPVEVDKVEVCRDERGHRVECDES